MPSIKVNFLLFSAPKQRLGVINVSFGQYNLVYTIKCRLLNYLGKTYESTTIYKLFVSALN